MKLIVEGWRSLSHSYAVVNQWQLLALSRRTDLTLRTRDLPHVWQKQGGLFPLDLARVLDEVPAPEPGFAPDITWRLGYPYDFTPAPCGKTVVFGTSEFQLVAASSLMAVPTIRADIADPRVSVVTPSQWSTAGFRKLGFDDARIAVIPHGVAPDIFRPSPETRARLRSQFNPSDFIFLHIGAMTLNKGMDVLLRAFAAVAEHRPEARLLLKGADTLYASGTKLSALMKDLPAPQAALVRARLIYDGAPLSMERMSGLYQAADAYVSPYRAEGFNMPVLEAAACGLPIICTGGGATDDFVTDAFALRIKSACQPVTLEGEDGIMLMPDQDHLTALMFQAMDDRSFREEAAVAGPAHMAGRFTWDHVADQMVRHMHMLAASR